MMKIYGDVRSGNCYKVKLICELLQRPYEWQAIDVLKGEAQAHDFVTLNPNAKIPFVIFEDGFHLSESNAIINYIAQGTPLYPADHKRQALIQQWQFFEQYSHEPFIAVARFINKYLGLPNERLDEYKSKQAGGIKALAVMDNALEQSDYLCGDAMTAADVSLFAYTHVADEGGFDLSSFVNIRAWITRVKASRGFVDIG